MVKQILLFYLLLQTLLSATVISEEQLKVVYTYNFMKNIEWENSSHSCKLAVITNNIELKKLFSILVEKKRVNNKKIQLSFHTSSADLPNSHLIYIDEEYKHLYRDIFQNSGNGTLLISNEVDDKQRIMINLIKINEKLDFQLNRANILNRDLKLSSDIVLLGGREIDIAEIYKDIQRKFERKRKEVNELNRLIESQKERQLKLNREIEEHRTELAQQEMLIKDGYLQLKEQKELIAKHKRELKLKQKELREKEKELEDSHIKLKALLSSVENSHHLLEDSQERYKSSLEQIASSQKELALLNNQITEKSAIVEAQADQLNLQDSTISYLEIAIGIFIFLVMFVLWANGRIQSDRRIIENQYTQLEELNSDLEIQFKTLEILHKDVKSSIRYASYIQNAIMPNIELFKRYFSDSFYRWYPRDGVGGDMFFVEDVSDNEVIIIVVDCTSHGVPGAMVTMLVKAVEKQLITEIQYGRLDGSSPATILQYFNREVKQLLNQSRDNYSASNVGFDGGVLYLNKKKNIVRYAGAETPLYYIESGAVKMTKYDRQSIGYPNSSEDYQFYEYSFSTETTKSFYLFTDGYYDQVGGDKHVMFGKRKLVRTLEEISEIPFEMHGDLLYNILENYQGNESRRDDLTFIGVKI